MRLSILPLILSLFIVFSVVGKPVIHSSTNASETLVMKLAPKKATLKKKNESLPIIGAESKRIKVDPSPNVKAKPTDAELQAKISFEENSYKNITSFVGANQNSNKEIQEASLTPINKTLFKQGFFYGMALIVVLLNLVCYFLFDERVFLIYSLALATVSIGLFNDDGLFSLFGLERIENGFITASVFLALGVGTSAVFAQKYLNIEEFYPKLQWITSLLFISASILIFTAWATQSIEVMIGAHILLFSILLAYFGAGVLLFSKKNYAKFYVIASSIPLLFAVDFYVLKPAGLHFLFTETIHLKVALFVEMIILTYAIMFRMKSLKEEHVLRQTELRIFLKRQESINRYNVEKMMEDMYLENLIMHYDLDGLEIKLLQYISEGKSNEKIARKLKLTEEGIEELTKDLYLKLEISEHIQEDYRMVEAQPDYIYN